MMSTKELWKSIEGYEGFYEVSNYGRLKSCARIGWNPRGEGFSFKRKERFLTLDFGRSEGYASTWLSKNGKARHFLAHKLVAHAFIGPCPDGTQVCHNDGTRNNNFVSNLRYDTPKNNQADTIRHGTKQIGSRKPTSKLTEADVYRIRERRPGETGRLLAEEFNMHPQRILAIRNGVDWRHVTA